MFDRNYRGVPRLGGKDHLAMGCEPLYRLPAQAVAEFIGKAAVDPLVTANTTLKAKGAEGCRKVDIVRKVAEASARRRSTKEMRPL